MISRMVARLVARNLGHQATDEEVLAEASATERYPCTDGEMLALCRAEIARHIGRVTGGYVTAAKRRSARRLAR